jgi:hypothetical protein
LFHVIPRIASPRDVVMSSSIDTINDKKLIEFQTQKEELLKSYYQMEREWKLKEAQHERDSQKLVDKINKIEFQISL